MAPELRRIGERVLTQVGENNPMGRMLIKNIKDPDKLEEKLQEKELVTFRDKTKEGLEFLVAYHEETLEKLVRGRFASELRNYGKNPQSCILNLAKNVTDFEYFAGFFRKFLSKTPEEHLADLSDVGHKRNGMDKCIGELSHNIIEAIEGEDGVQKLEKQHKGRGMKTLNRRGIPSGIGDGALFIYDKDKTAKVIPESEWDDVFKDKRIPRDVDQFARFITYNKFDPGTLGWRLVGTLYADPVNARLGL